MKTYIVIFSLISTQVCLAESIPSEREKITSNTIHWIEQEPNQIANSLVYRKWKKDFFVMGAQEAQRYQLPKTLIRYAEIDFNNDSRREIIVQEAEWYSGGYALGIFEKKGISWKLIAHHRGAFVAIPKHDQPYELLLIERLGADYSAFIMKYAKGRYVVKEEWECEIGFNQFWGLNFSNEESIRAKARKQQPAEDGVFTRPREACINPKNYLPKK